MPSQDVLFDVLKRFATTLTGEFDVVDVLCGLTDHTVEVLSAASAGVLLADEDEDGTLKFLSSDSTRAAELEAVQLQSGQGPCHQAFTSGEIVVVTDINDHLEWPTYRIKASDVGLRAVLGIPLMLGGERLGAFNVYDEHPRTWADDDVAAARVLANIATSYVLHDSQMEASQRINEQLRKALHSRVIIEQAKGLLAGELGISLEDSFAIMRQHARSNQASLRAVAEAVVNLGMRPQGGEG